MEDRGRRPKIQNALDARRESSMAGSLSRPTLPSSSSSLLPLGAFVVQLVVKVVKVVVVFRRFLQSTPLRTHWDDDDVLGSYRAPLPKALLLLRRKTHTHTHTKGLFSSFSSSSFYRVVVSLRARVKSTTKTRGRMRLSSSSHLFKDSSHLKP